MNCSKIKVVLIFLFSITIAFGQLKNESVKVKITLLNGTNKEGFIESADEKSLSEAINFKESEKDKEFIHYTTANLKSFLISDAVKYEALAVKANKNTTPIHVFSKLIIKGKASLYKSFYNTLPIFIVVRDSSTYVLQNDILEFNKKEFTRYNYAGYLSLATEGMSNSNAVIDFDEKTFVSIITAYNETKQSENIIYSPKKEKPVNFQMIYGGFGKGDDGNVIVFQALNRLFYPSFSRTTSLNFGINYYYEKYQIKGFSYPGNKFSTTRQVIGIPLLIQQSFSTKSIRPFVFTGIGLTYRKVTSDLELPQPFPYSSKEFGVTFSYGGGVEIDIIKGFMAKAEYKYDFYGYFLASLGYRF